MRESKSLWSGYPYIAVVLAAALWAVFFGSTSLLGQSSMGTISGVVTDPTGAVVPNAQVRLTDESTNIAVTTKSNRSGVYVFPNVSPGTYQLTVSASGFKTYTARHIVMYVNQQVTENATLSVGATTTSVEVEAKLPLVQTSSSSVGG